MDSKSNTQNLKKIFIQRDYTHGTNIRFQITFPQELDGLISPQSFTDFIEILNSMYEEAEQMNTKICMESCFACLTAYIFYLCFDTYFDKSLKKIAAYIEEQNDILFKPNGFYVVDPLQRGLRVIEVVVNEQHHQHRVH